MSTYPCLESPLGNRGRRPAPTSRVRSALFSVLLAAVTTRTARTRSQG